MQLFKAETPGPVADKIRPRVRDTAARLWGIYLLFTLCESSALIALHVPPFEALCHAFTTMSTGGFSTHDASISYYESAAVDAVITTFMLIGGINFVLYFRIAAGGWRRIARESELKFFALLFAAASITTVATLRLDAYPSWGEAARYGVFQVASIITTTGYATANFETWPYLIQGTLIVVMFTGAMAGSTAGGMKSVRVLLLFKQGFQQLRLLVHPHAVTRVRLSGQKVAPEIIHAIWGFFFLYLVTFGVTALSLTAQGLDLVTAATAAITALNNVGPGLGDVGPAENFASLPAAAKWLLSLCMLLGRLEIYTVLVLFLPEYWRR
jgi:trk system potassium uptake protein TrkH